MEIDGFELGEEIGGLVERVERRVVANLVEARPHRLHARIVVRLLDGGGGGPFEHFDHRAVLRAHHRGVAISGQPLGAQEVNVVAHLGDEDVVLSGLGPVGDDDDTGDGHERAPAREDGAFLDFVIGWQVGAALSAASPVKAGNADLKVRFQICGLAAGYVPSGVPARRGRSHSACWGSRRGSMTRVV